MKFICQSIFKDDSIGKVLINAENFKEVSERYFGTGLTEEDNIIQVIFIKE